MVQHAVVDALSETEHTLDLLQRQPSEGGLDHSARPIVCRIAGPLSPLCKVVSHKTCPLEIETNTFIVLITL